MQLEINGDNLDLEQVWQVAYDNVTVNLAEESRAKMQKSRDYIDHRLKRGDVMYGINTGFGAFSDVKISDADIEKLQINLIRSHSVGIGEPFSKQESRAIMLLRANALARGHSGIRPLIVDKILEFLNHDVIPYIPQQGSVGASGDLAPLSHLALALIGEGEVWQDGTCVAVETVLQKKNIAPLKLKAKEGLSLINGCQVMTAVGLLNAYESRRLTWMVDCAGAMSLEALKGTRSAFDPLIFATRPHPGEAKTARNILKLLGETSEIAESHRDCGRVQDAYSLRCIPAVHGAAKDSLAAGLERLIVEANSSTDNPLVFPDEDKVLSCGNFHGEPVAFALDNMCIAMSAMVSISECRIEKLINPAMSQLPAFFFFFEALNSRMMIVQVPAASLVSENKILSHPASVDSIPTSADKEHHVSMGTIAARKLGKIVGNAENVVAMEMLCAAQAIDLLEPLKPASAIAKVHSLLREFVPFAKEDRVFAKDVEAIKKLIRKDMIIHAIEETVGKLEF
ncbi:MAG: histidine ammonia-lyase [Bdellovibrionales bacterium]|nr:histidine ammonia-lyase [Bdellovibrionales bacterium]